MEKITLTAEQHEYCKEQIRQRLIDWQESKIAVSRSIGKYDNFLFRYLYMPNATTTVDTIRKLLTYFHLSFELIFTNSTKVSYVIIHKNGMIYDGHVVHRYISYGQHEVKCIRWVSDVKNGMFFSTRSQAERVAKTIKDSQVLKRTELKGAVSWSY